MSALDLLVDDLDEENDATNDKNFAPLSGLEYDDIRRLLAEKCDGVDLKRDDPIFWVLTIFNAALENADEQGQRREQRLASQFESSLKKTLTSFEAAIKPASELALNTQLSALLDNVREETKIQTRLRSNMRFTALLISFSALIALCSAVVNFILLVK